MMRMRALVVLLALLLPAGALAQGICPNNSLGSTPTLITTLPFKLALPNFCQTLVFNSSSPGSVQLPAPGTNGGFIPNFPVFINNIGSGTLTLTPLQAQTGPPPRVTPKINGQTTVQIVSGGIAILSVGADFNWYAALGISQISGPAGGDLSGSYPNPTVASIGGKAFVLGGALTIANLTNTNSLMLETSPGNIGELIPGAGVVTALGATPTGSGGIVLATSPTLTTPNLGTPSAINLANATNLPATAMPALTGDVTSTAGSVATTVGAIGGNAFSLGGAVTIANLTSVNGLTYISSAGHIGQLTAGLNGQILVGSTGGPSGFLTMGRDCTISSVNGNVTCTSTQGVPFATSATTDTTNGSNISSGTVGIGRLGILSDGAAPASWTPTDQSGASLTFTSVTGTFTKLNKTCVGSFRVTFPNTASASAANISLPCTFANIGGNHAIGSCWATGTAANFNTLIIAAVANSATTFFQGTAGGTATNANISNGGSTSVLSCTFAFNST